MNYVKVQLKHRVGSASVLTGRRTGSLQSTQVVYPTAPENSNLTPSRTHPAPIDPVILGVTPRNQLIFFVLFQNL